MASDADTEWEREMQFLGTLAFGVMTVVNLIVLGLVVVGLVRHSRRR